MSTRNSRSSSHHETGIILYPMTLFYFNIMCWFAMFLLYSSSIFDIVMIYDGFMYLFVERLIQFSSGLGGKNNYVSMVLRYDLPADSSYIPGVVVVRGSDSPVESFVFHPPSIRLVDNGFKDYLAMFMIFLNNLPDI